MKLRKPLIQLLLLIATFGIYAIYWLVSTKNELVGRGASVPTAWLLLVPIANVWWMWKYCQGVETVTGGRPSAPVSFLLFAVLGVVGIFIVQDGFNKSGLSPQTHAAIA